jgi:hypothetical protein
MDGERRLYGAIETQQSPWLTTVWKEIETKADIVEMKVSTFVNFCEDTLQSKQALQSLFDPQTRSSLSIDEQTLEELVLRALLLLPGQQSIFSTHSLAQIPPVDCLNVLLSSNTSKDH